MSADYWKVTASFYVPKAMAPTARAAEDLVGDEVDLGALKDSPTDSADVHEGETVEWDMEG